MLKLFKLNRRPNADDELRAVIDEHELPTFPAVVMQALQMLRDDRASTPAIGELISQDPGLSARLLQTVNSAAFAVKHRVRNVPHAVSLLGRSQVESMLISLAVGDALPREPAPGYDRLRFWHAAAHRAATAGALAEIIDPSRRSESFTAALLQDMALPLLAHRQGRQYGRILEQWHHGTEDLARLERECFPWDHAEVAALLSAELKLPELLGHAIGSHHGTGDPDWAELPAVRLVSLLREVNEDPGIELLIETAHESYHVARDAAAAAVEQSREAAGEIAALFT